MSSLDKTQTLSRPVFLVELPGPGEALLDYLETTVPEKYRATRGQRDY